MSDKTAAEMTDSQQQGSSKELLSEKLSELQIEEILSCTKVQESVEHTDPAAAIMHDIELGDLDEKIAQKLEQIKARSIPLLANPTGEASRWLLRQDPDAPKRRWLVARNTENEMEISVDVCLLLFLPSMSLLILTPRPTVFSYLVTVRCYWHLDVFNATKWFARLTRRTSTG